MFKFHKLQKNKTYKTINVIKSNNNMRKEQCYIDNPISNYNLEELLLLKYKFYIKNKYSKNFTLCNRHIHI